MMEKIKVLIVDDIAQTRTDLRRLLYFEEDLSVVGEAANGEEALEQEMCIRDSGNTALLSFLLDQHHGDNLIQGFLAALFQHSLV